MLMGAHVLLYSQNAEADRAFFRDVLKFPHVNVGHGWLIFALPPAELAVHPLEGDKSSSPAIDAEVYLMTSDLKAMIKDLAAKNVRCAPLEEAPWGIRTTIELPSGGKLGLYEPRHETAFGLKRG